MSKQRHQHHQQVQASRWHVMRNRSLLSFGLGVFILHIHVHAMFKVACDEQPFDDLEQIPFQMVLLKQVGQALHRHTPTAVLPSSLKQGLHFFFAYLTTKGLQATQMCLCTAISCIDACQVCIFQGHLGPPNWTVSHNCSQPSVSINTWSRVLGSFAQHIQHPNSAFLCIPCWQESQQWLDGFRFTDERIGWHALPYDLLCQQTLSSNASQLTTCLRPC